MCTQLRIPGKGTNDIPLAAACSPAFLAMLLYLLTRLHQIYLQYSDFIRLVAGPADSKLRRRERRLFGEKLSIPVNRRSHLQIAAYSWIRSGFFSAKMGAMIVVAPVKRGTTANSAADGWCCLPRAGGCGCIAAPVDHSKRGWRQLILVKCNFHSSVKNLCICVDLGMPGNHPYAQLAIIGGANAKPRACLCPTPSASLYQAYPAQRPLQSIEAVRITVTIHSVSAACVATI